MATLRRREPEGLDRLRDRRLEVWGSTTAWSKAMHAYCDEHGLDYRDVLDQLGPESAEWREAATVELFARRADRVGIPAVVLRRDYDRREADDRRAGRV